MRVKIRSVNFGEHAVVRSTKDEIVRFLELSEVQLANNCTKKLRNYINKQLTLYGWSNAFKVDTDSGITITSIKDRIGLCLQTGNMARIYADLLKLQTLYIKDTIETAIIIVPTKEAAAQMGNNLTSMERLVSELCIFKHIITLPLIILGIENKEEEL